MHHPRLNPIKLQTIGPSWFSCSINLIGDQSLILATLASPSLCRDKQTKRRRKQPSTLARWWKSSKMSLEFNLTANMCLRTTEVLRDKAAADAKLNTYNIMACCIILFLTSPIHRDEAVEIYTWFYLKVIHVQVPSLFQEIIVFYYN